MYSSVMFYIFSIEKVTIGSILVILLPIIDPLYFRYCGPWCMSTVSLLSFLSPPLMLAVPHAGVVHFRDTQLVCDVSGNIDCFTYGFGS